MTFVRRTTALLFAICLMAGVLLAGPGDSLKVRWINGQKYMLHKVMPKETWSSVSRKYEVTLEALQKANAGVTVLKIGQIINVPAASTPSQTTAVQTEKTTAPPVKAPVTAGEKIKYHTVLKGETLYGIARQYGISVAELKTANNITTESIATGQKLKISSTTSEIAVTPVATPEPSLKTVSPTIAPPPVKKDTPVTATPANIPVTTAPVNTSQSAGTPVDMKMEPAGERVVENGVATWIADSEMNQNKFYALHRTAPIGTIIKVTNRMNNNSVYVKVIGVLPSTGDNENILIKITQAAAQRIGALDQRFQAELSYASAVTE